MPRRRGRAVWAVSAMVAVAAAAAFVIGDPADPSPSDGRPATAASTDAGPQQPAIRIPPTTLPDGSSSAVRAELHALAQSATPEPGTSAADPPITGDAAGQPDLYAEAFVQRLMTRDYATPREDLLAWVQAQTAVTTEPTVVGLIPADLRPKWPLFSLTSMAPPPVPPPAEWAALGSRRGRATCTVQRVTEPPPWADAVSDGTITDPGITAREVSATLTTTTGGPDQTATTVSSIALTIYLQGPPTRPAWAFAGAVLYTEVEVSRS